MPGRTHSRARHPVGSAAPSWVEGWSRLAGVILQMGSHLGVHLARVSPRPAVGGFKRRRLPRAATPAPGTPWRWRAAWSGSPAPSSQRWSESRAEVLADDHHRAAVRAPAAAARCSSRSCSACLPIRIGGFDQISSYVASAGTLRRASHAVNRSGQPERRGVLVGQQHGPLVDLDPGDARPPAVRRGTPRRGDGQPDHAVPDAEVEHAARRRAARSRGTARPSRCRAGPRLKTPEPLTSVEPLAPHLAA